MADTFSQLKEVCKIENMQKFKKLYTDALENNLIGGNNMGELLQIACYNGRLKIVQFLCKTDPSNYNIENIIGDYNFSIFDKVCDIASSDDPYLSGRCYQLLYWVIKEAFNKKLAVYGSNKNIREYCLNCFVSFIERSKNVPNCSLNRCIVLQNIFHFTNQEIMVKFRENERYKTILEYIPLKFASWIILNFIIDLDMIKNVVDKHIVVDPGTYVIFKNVYENRINTN